MIKVGGLWKHKKDGVTYLSGQIELISGLKHKVLVYPISQDKKKPNSPDYSVSVEALPIVLKEKPNTTSSVKVTTEDI